MISCIQGEVWEVNDDNLVVLAGGLGYQVYVPLACFAAQPSQGEAICLYTDYFDSLYCSAFHRILFWQNTTGNPLFLCFSDNGEHTFYRLHFPIQSKFPDDQRIFNIFRRKMLQGCQNADGDRQIKQRAFFP